MAACDDDDYDGDAGDGRGRAVPSFPGPSLRPNGSRPTASRSTLRTLWTSDSAHG